MSKWSSPSPQLIQRFRRLAGMTIAEASEAMKVDPSLVSKWENGIHKPTAKSLNKLAIAYDRDVSDFYLVDIATVRAEATSDLMNYFRDPDANKDRRASIASHLLIQLPDNQDKEPDSDDQSKSIDEILSNGNPTQE